MSHTTKSYKSRRRISFGGQSGQAMLFLLMTLVILVFAILLNLDVHKILRLKFLSQNGGDAAALAAARWQGITLNIVGDLNIMQAVAIAEEDEFTIGAISNIQARLLYTGPMIAVEASQQAAKNNKMYANDDFTDRMRAHAARVREVYPYQTDSDGEMMFPEPYPNAWEEYADMLDAVANNGVAAGPDNAHYYNDRTGGHTLLRMDFYDAVAGESWCWFYHHDYELLQTYSSYNDWDELPPIPHQEYINSELFGLGLTKQTATLEDITGDPTAFTTLFTEIMEERMPGSAITETSTVTEATWYTYSSSRWGTWDIMNPEAPEFFPLTGTLKEQYNYRGADAVCRINSDGLTLLTPDQQAPMVVWSAAAKPFGFLNDTERPNDYTLVIPAYHQVAMIPVDASSAPSGGSYNIEWRDHIELHLDPYMAGGTGALDSDCYYCAQLTTWERDSFRESGVDWLSENSYLCTLPGSSGGRRGGGTRRGH
ncbi:hypothetical protein BVX97_04770 [bacterium E08(2017)]|nr:hypothetical protein BVX97_04770 [bacterium E08(2017)]